VNQPQTTGQILYNRYRIVRLMGQGGFGAVYRAWDLNLQKPVALKQNLDVSREAERQFFQEASILSQLVHPNLPRVTDHFSLPGQGQFLVMDFVEGEDMQTMIDCTGGPLPEAQVLNWISQICDALDYLHSQNPPIIHRDIKPANVRVTPDGRAMLVDFGIAKVFDPHRKTTLGARAVTPGYSPIEQYGQGSTDARTDIYALAGTLYTALTGEVPLESIQRAAQDMLQPPHLLNPQISPPVEGAILTGLNLNPGDRFQTAREFKNALSQKQVISPTAVMQKAAPVVVAQTSVIPQVQPSYPLQSQPSVPLPGTMGLSGDAGQRGAKLPGWTWLLVGAGGVAALLVILALFLVINGPGIDGSSVNGTSLALQQTMNSMTGTAMSHGAILPTATRGVVAPPPTQIQPLATQVQQQGASRPTPQSPPTRPPAPTSPPSPTPVPPEPIFTANQDMYCRGGPGTEYEAHYSVKPGQALPVLARWENGWLLLGINEPEKTRTRCCWVGANGTLNVSLSSIPLIDYLPDRINCPLNP
jgi:serine/threonine protein kinase